MKSGTFRHLREFIQRQFEGLNLGKRARRRTLGVDHDRGHCRSDGGPFGADHLGGLGLNAFFHRFDRRWCGCVGIALLARSALAAVTTVTVA